MTQIWTPPLGLDSAPALEVGVRGQRTGGSARILRRHHWLAARSRGSHYLHNWPSPGEGGGRGPVVRIGRAEEEEEEEEEKEEERSAAQLKACCCQPFGFNTPTALSHSDKSGTTAGQQIHLLPGVLAAWLISPPNGKSSNNPNQLISHAPTKFLDCHVL